MFLTVIDLFETQRGAKWASKFLFGRNGKNRSVKNENLLVEPVFS